MKKKLKNEKKIKNKKKDFEKRLPPRS